MPELYLAALGTLKNGCVFCPLFSAFGPEPIQARMEIGQAKVLEHVLLIDVFGSPPAGTIELGAALAAASDSFEVAPTAPEDMALLHFTSGTTGRPKGAVHVHVAVVAHQVTGRFALDLSTP